MAPKKNPTQIATVHSTNTDTSAGHTNNQAVTCRDLDMLARNLTAAFSEQLRAVINNTPTQQRMLEDMSDQIKNLQERIEPHQEIPKSHESQDGNARMSHSNRSNKKRRERSRTLTSLDRKDPRDDESKTAFRESLMKAFSRWLIRGGKKESKHKLRDLAAPSVPSLCHGMRPTRLAFLKISYQ